MKRLRRAEGHLRSIIGMIEIQRPYLDVAQIARDRKGQAKKTLIHDHIENCLERAVGPFARKDRRPLEEFKAITKYL